MTKVHFRKYNSKQILLFPQRLDENIEENDPVRVVDAIVESLNLEEFKKLYRQRGRSPYHPKMMLKVIIYAYMNNVYSCRKIEKLLTRDIHYIWLAGNEKPDYITINRFRNRVKDEINNIFTQLVLLLVQRGFIRLDVAYIDGTKIESKANKYTFVWRKSVEKNRSKLMAKISILLQQIDDVIAQDNTCKSEQIKFTPESLTALIDELKENMATQSADNSKDAKQALRLKKRQVKELEKHRDKLEEYDSRLEQIAERNSMSKTDTSATFMRMKEDAMNNGQTKPGYNLQIASENQFITNFGIFNNPTDTLTLIPFNNLFHQRFNRFPNIEATDSGYGSEENYHFLEENDIEAYVKYNYFHKEHRPRYKPNPFHPDNWHYNEEKDYYVCPMGQHLEFVGLRHDKTASGYITESSRYKATNCKGCPLRGECYKAKSNRRTIEVNHRLNEYKKKARERLTSEEGIKHRGRRCIEPEAIFGQMKNNMQYKRFRHFGIDKVTMDFAFFAIAFNIKKMCSKIAKGLKNGENLTFFSLIIFFNRFLDSVNRIFCKKMKFDDFTDFRNLAA